MTENLKQLQTELTELGLAPKTDEPLSKHTTWKIGGPADLFVHTRATADFKQAVKSAQNHSVPYTVLGWGSNVLISDDGLRGLVIKNSSMEIEIEGETDTKVADSLDPQPRLVSVDNINYYDFKDLDYDESDFPRVKVKAASGVNLPFLINNLINNGITGLQWFSGIPGTVGGAVYNNIHGGNHFFSEYVNSVVVLTKQGQEKTLAKEELQFDYDFSILHHTEDVILTTELILVRGDKNRARNTAIAWATRKKLQPYNSSGCCFQNLDPKTQQDLSLESNSWGYIVDKVLGLKGYNVGKAKVSPKHAAFIETEEGASSNDVLAIFDEVNSLALEKLGIKPKLEVFLLGFPEGIKQKYS